jgi:hypothetical protein
VADNLGSHQAPVSIAGSELAECKIRNVYPAHPGDTAGKGLFSTLSVEREPGQAYDEVRI